MDVASHQDAIGQTSTEDLVTTMDPLESEAAGKEENQEENGIIATQSTRAGPPASAKDPLDQEGGATHMFNDMHGVSMGLEDPDKGFDETLSSTQVRQMALTHSASDSGVTDWAAGTDGSKSGEPHNGVVYGSFAGV